MIQSIYTALAIFEKHGIHSNQIPRLFGYGLTLADVTDHDKLLAKLVPEILQIACKLFAVRLVNNLRY